MPGLDGFQAVLFDLDGTLVDAFKPIAVALNTILEEHGHEPMSLQDVRRHTGRGEGGITALFGDRWPEVHARFLEVHDTLYLKYIEPLPGAYQLLQWLKSTRVPVGVVTNKTQVRAEAQIGHLDWRQLIDAIVGIRDDNPGKPDPANILMAGRELGADLPRTILIGDGTADMQAAYSAGCYAVGLTTTFTADEMKDSGAARCFPSLPEVHAWLRTLATL